MGFDGSNVLAQIKSFGHFPQGGSFIDALARFAGLSLQGVFERHAVEDPDRVLLVFGEETLRYGRAQLQARALAAALHNLGVGVGDRIGIDLSNGPEFVISGLAAAYLGATIVPLNPADAPHELQFVLRNSEASVVVVAEQFGGQDNLELFERIQFNIPDLQYVVTVGEEDLWYDDRIFQFEDLVSSGEGKDVPEVTVDPGSDVYAILYTAGTTGKPKGVMLTHTNLVQTNAAAALALGLTSSDLVLIAVPLFNIFGLAALVSVVCVGATAVLMEEFEPTASLELAAAARVTVVHGAPTTFALQVRSGALDRLDLSSLRTGIVAGAPVMDSLVRRVRERFLPELEIGYGLTETSSLLSMTRRDDPPEKRNYTAGRPLEGVEVRVLDEDGSMLPVESIGELVVRGFNVMKGYHRQPDETSRSFTEGGFFKTGDLGMLDEDGYLHIVGRKQDTIVRGEYTIYPGELEDLLRLHPAVQEVVVVGLEDPVLGERICACIMPVEGAIVTGDEIKEFARGQVAQYKVPDVVKFIESFPLTGSGKVRRIELARMMRTEQATRRAL